MRQGPYGFADGVSAYPEGRHQLRLGGNPLPIPHFLVLILVWSCEMTWSTSADR